MNKNYKVYLAIGLCLGMAYIVYSVEKFKTENIIAETNKLEAFNEQLEFILEEINDKKRVMGTA